MSFCYLVEPAHEVSGNQKLLCPEFYQRVEARMLTLSNTALSLKGLALRASDRRTKIE